MKVIIVLLVLLIVAIIILAMIIVSNTRKMSNKINKLESYHNDEIIMIKNLIKSEQSDKEVLIKMTDVQSDILKFVKNNNETISGLMKKLVEELHKIIPAKKVKKPENNN